MNNIRRIRMARHMTQKELAKRLGCTDAAVSNYERSARRLDYELLLRISEALSCTVSDLVADSIVFEASERMPISENEQQLILMYRKLNQPNQDNTMEYMKFLYQLQAKPKGD